MDMLRSVLFSDRETDVWGYISESGAEIRLGNKHHAERICHDKSVDCVKLTPPSCDDLISEASPRLGEGTTLISYLSTTGEEFMEAVKKQLNQRHEKLNAALLTKKGGAHFSVKSDYKRSKEKENTRKQLNDE